MSRMIDRRGGRWIRHLYRLEKISTAEARRKDNRPAGWTAPHLYHATTLLTSDA